MTTHYDITDAPPIPGLQFRSFAGVTDAGALHAILSGSVVLRRGLLLLEVWSRVRKPSDGRL